MALQPGFTDEGGGREQPEAHAPATAEMSAAPLAPPMLLDALDEAPGDRVDHGWAPELIRPASVPAGSLAWLAGGLMLLAVGWIGLSMLDFMHEQFARSNRLGYVALAICLVAAGLVLRGVLIEVRAYGALQSVEIMRTALSRFDVSLSDAKRLSTTWLDTVSARLPNPESVQNSIAAASDLPELRAILRSRVLKPLDQVARQLARTGAMQGGAAVAIVPSPALDGVFAGIRGLSLIRQIAQVYGLRPGLAVTISLLRRISWTAAGVAGVDFLAKSAVANVLHSLPVVKHIAAAVPETSFAAIRLYRLGIITAKACSPLIEE